jgi:amino acid transporter
MELSTHSSARLKRVVGVPGVAFSAFNGIVGAGIFGLPGLVSGILGPAAVFAYLVAMVLTALLGLCFAEAGSRVARSGGLYAYASVAFGPVVGGVTGVLLLFANSIAAAAALSRFFLDTLASQMPIFVQPAPSIGLLAVIYALLALVNARGAREGAWLTVAIGVIKFVPLLLLVVVGVFAIHPENLSLRALPKISRLGQGALLLIFAFQGVESGLNISGEMRDPARTAPRAILLALSMVGVLYIGLQASAQGVLGARLANAPAPLIDLARALFGPTGATLMAVASLLSAGGYIIADMMGSPRIAYALATEGQLPRWLAYVHPRFHTPAVAIGLYAVSVVLLTASGAFLQLAIMATAGSMVMYMIVCLGVLRLRAKAVAQAGAPFRIPGGAIVPLLATALMIWILSTLSLKEWLSTAALIILSALIYGVKAHLDRRKSRASA